jgi:hypothetical protein
MSSDSEDIMKKLNKTLFFCGIVLACMAFSAGRAEQTTIERSSDGRSLKLVIDGELEFTNDDRDIAKISPGGSFLIRQDDGTTLRRLKVLSASDGTLTRSYHVDGLQAPWGSEGEEWLAGLLPEIIRESAIGVEARARRILEQKGAEGLLQEIALIRSSGSKRRYFRELFKQADLKPDLLRRAAGQMAKIHSDGDKSRLLIEVSPQYLAEDDLLDGFFEAVRSIRSDGDHRRVLESILEQSRANSLSRVFQSAAKISSDGDKTAVLVKSVRLLSNSEQEQLDYLKSARSIRSDGDRRRALEALLQSDELTPAARLNLLRAAAEIHSDGDKARVLSKAAESFPNDPELWGEYLKTVRAIRSDGDKDRALEKLLSRDQLSAETLASTKDVVSESIRSSGTRKRLQMKIAQYGGAR